MVSMVIGLSGLISKSIWDMVGYSPFYSLLDELVLLLILLVVTGVTNYFMCNQMKPLPDKLQLDIMWTVATSTAIETGIRPHILFARLLYDEFNDIKPPVGLAD